MKSRRRKLRLTEPYLEALFTAAEYLESAGEMRAAFQCLLAAAQGGHRSSQINLGTFYANGTGVHKNLKEAAHWYRKSYDGRGRSGRYSSAAINLAIDYRNAGNLTSAVKWFERARALKDGDACLHLARIHAERRGGRKKAIAMLREVLELDSNYATDLDKEDARAMLKDLEVRPLLLGNGV